MTGTYALGCLWGCGTATHLVAWEPARHVAYCERHAHEAVAGLRSARADYVAWGCWKLEPVEVKA